MDTTNPIFIYFQLFPDTNKKTPIKYFTNILHSKTHMNATIFKTHPIFRTSTQTILILSGLTILLFIILELIHIAIIPNIWPSRYPTGSVTRLDLIVQHIPQTITLIIFWTYCLFLQFKKFACIIKKNGDIEIKHYNFFQHLHIAPHQIRGYELKSRKTIWGTFENVQFIYCTEFGKLKVIELPLQEPQKFIEEVEKIRKSSK